ncbi:MAG: DUF4340 domain-containing protein [Limisphaerales bacterium]
MSRKQFIFVLLALCIIGGAGLALFKRNQKTWNVREAKVGEFVIPDFHPNDIAAIHIKAESDFRVVRTNGIWRVPDRYDYPANFSQVSELLLDIKKLKVMQSEVVGQSLRARVDLNEPGKGPGSGQLVEFEDANGKVLASLLLGRKHDRKQNENEPLGLRGWFDGRYVLLPSEPNNILLVPNELPAAATEPGAWVDHTFFKIENPKIISLVSPDPQKNWQITRETPTAKWTMDGLNSGESLDVEKIAQATEIWAFPTFLDMGMDLPASITGLDKPTVITVVTFDNVAYTLKVGKQTPAGNHVITVSVAADFSAGRNVSPDETPDDKKRLDEEFQAKKKTLEEKVAKDRALGRWMFVVDNWLDVVLRDRSQLVQAKSATQEASRF